MVNMSSGSQGASNDFISIEKERLLDMYIITLKIRFFENKVQELYQNKTITGAVHLCSGQEAIYAGSSAALLEGDYVTCTYRGHGAFISRGADMKKMMAEILGKSSGLCKGKGGSMHLADFSKGLLGSFAIVGEGITVAVGAGLSSKLLNQGKIAATFFGDGATNIGMFHESLNLAAVWKLPVIFICENNLYGEYTPLDKTTSVSDIAVRASSYNIPGVIANGNDVVDVYLKIRDACVRARKMDGPTLIECKTFRLRGHSEMDQGNYRSAQELEFWKARDPIENLRKILYAQGNLSEHSDEEIQTRIHMLVEEATDFAINSPFSAPGEILTDVYSK